MRLTRILAAQIDRAAALVGFLAAVTATVIEWTLPYRIGPVEYVRWLWYGRFAMIAFLSGYVGLALGLRRAAWPAVVMGAASLALLLIFPNGVHSGPSPENWCYNNLRSLEAAKEELAMRGGAANGEAVTMDALLPCLGLQLPDCVARGRYSPCPMGVHPKCSVHGSMKEMEHW